MLTFYFNPWDITTSNLCLPKVELRDIFPAKVELWDTFPAKPKAMIKKNLEVIVNLKKNIHVRAFTGMICVIQIKATSFLVDVHVSYISSQINNITF